MLVMGYHIVHTLPDDPPTWTVQSYHVIGLHIPSHSPPVWRVHCHCQQLEYHPTHPTHPTALIPNQTPADCTPQGRSSWWDCAAHTVLLVHRLGCPCCALGGSWGCTIDILILQRGIWWCFRGQRVKDWTAHTHSLAYTRIRPMQVFPEDWQMYPVLPCCYSIKW